MAKRTLYEKNLIKDIQKLSTSLKGRISTISKTLGASNPLVTNNIAKNKFEELILSVKGKSTRELQTLRRDLKYISNLKSSSIKTYNQYIESGLYMTKLSNQLVEQFNKGKEKSEQIKGYDYDKRLWKIYSEYVEENKLVDKYKYEILDTIMNSLYDSKHITDKVIKERIDKMLPEGYKRLSDSNQTIDNKVERLNLKLEGVL